MSEEEIFIDVLFVLSQLFKNGHHQMSFDVTCIDKQRMFSIFNDVDDVILSLPSVLAGHAGTLVCLRQMEASDVIRCRPNCS